MKNILMFLVIFIEFNGKVDGIEFNNRYRRWIGPCNSNNCDKIIEKCISIDCLGRIQCRRCVEFYSLECSECIYGIFDLNEQEVINDKIQFICDKHNEIQTKACTIYCRGNMYYNGSCETKSCECFNDFINIK
jgi:hypothetical protein